MSIPNSDPSIRTRKKAMRWLGFVIVLPILGWVIVSLLASLPWRVSESGGVAAQRLERLTGVPAGEFAAAKFYMSVGIRAGPRYYSFRAGPEIRDQLLSRFQMVPAGVAPLRLVNRPAWWRSQAQPEGLSALYYRDERADVELWLFTDTNEIFLRDSRGG